MSFRLPKVKHGAHVGLLGGSFDPPHLGHQMLALAALCTKPLDALWVIPCADHAFRKTLTGFEDRYQMCLLAFQKIRNVCVLDLEQHLPKPSYTIHTVKTILETRPDLNLSLVMGSDLMQDFDSWQGSTELKSLCRLDIFDRSTIFPAAKSSEIKLAIKTGDFSYLDCQITNYVRKKNLYLHD